MHHILLCITSWKSCYQLHAISCPINNTSLVIRVLCLSKTKVNHYGVNKLQNVVSKVMPSRIRSIKAAFKKPKASLLVWELYSIKHLENCLLPKEKFQHLILSHRPISKKHQQFWSSRWQIALSQLNSNRRTRSASLLILNLTFSPPLGEIYGI